MSHIAIRNYKGQKGMIRKGDKVEAPDKEHIKLGLVISEDEYNKKLKEAKKRSDKLTKEAKKISQDKAASAGDVTTLQKQLDEASIKCESLEAEKFALETEVKRLTILIDEPKETPINEPDETPTNEPDETPTDKPKETKGK